MPFFPDRSIIKLIRIDVRNVKIFLLRPCVRKYARQIASFPFPDILPSLKEWEGVKIQHATGESAYHCTWGKAECVPVDGNAIFHRTDRIPAFPIR